MNKHQAIALLVVLTTGCSAPRSFMAETGGEETQQKYQSLSRMQSVAQLQVDAASVYGQMIEYYLNGEETTGVLKAVPAMQTVSRQLDAVLSFKAGSTELLPAYSGNRAELERITRELSILMADAGSELQAVRITGYASPDGTTARNEELATGRALRFSSYLSGKLSLPRQKIAVAPCVEDWEGLGRLVAEAKKPYAAQVASVLAGNSQPDARRKALKAIDKGRAWKDMEQTLFVRLRRMELEVVCLSQEPVAVSEAETAPAKTSDLNRLLALFNSRPEQLTLDELLAIAPVFRPGTEQYREVYELAAYRFPDCIPAQLNAGAAALAATDTEAARFFLERVQNDPRAWINLGVLALMEHDTAGAADWFRKAMPQKPVQARLNLQLLKIIDN